MFSNCDDPARAGAAAPRAHLSARPSHAPRRPRVFVPANENTADRRSRDEARLATTEAHDAGAVFLRPLSSSECGLRRDGLSDESKRGVSYRNFRRLPLVTRGPTRSGRRGWGRRASEHRPPAAVRWSPPHRKPSVVPPVFPASFHVQTPAYRPRAGRATRARLRAGLPRFARLGLFKP